MLKKKEYNKKLIDSILPTLTWVRNIAAAFIKSMLCSANRNS